MKKSAKEQLHDYLLGTGGWCASGILQRMEFKNEDGTIASPASIDRRLRELENECLIAVKYENKHHSYYKHIPVIRRPFYIPTSERPKGKEKILFREFPQTQLRFAI